MTARAVLALVVAAAFPVLAATAHAQQTQMLAQGPVEALPPDGSFLSIVALPQPAGASLGPHAHVPGFVYVVSGETKTVDPASGMTMTLSEGEGLFIPALAVHTHKHPDNRVAAGALAVGLLVLVIVLLLVVWFSPARVLLVPPLLVAAIASGAIALQNPWSNDWFFIGVRPEEARGAPMPIPSATPTYESPELSSVAPGPYVESLATTTVDPQGELAASTAPGPVVFLVLEGRADVTVGSEAPIRLEHHGGTLVQAGESFRILNPSESALRLLRFALTPKSGSS